MNFVSCVKWVKQGVSQNVPEHVNLNEDELKQLVNSAGNELDDGDEANSESQSKEDEYDFQNYDNEDGNFRATLEGIVTFDEGNSKKKKKKKNKSNEPKSHKRPKHESMSDSENEDEVIKSNDNLLLVGHVDGDLSTVDVYIYNENDDDMYIHHDLMLKSAPLCIEWLSVETVSGPGNMCAVGTMNSVIEVWDLDLINCVEPISKLGRAKKKDVHKNFGHTDAVLALAWNSELPHILCSGSVDQQALLWDLDCGKVATEMNEFSDKVQALSWNPYSPHYLLTACADGYLRNFDCRVYDQFQKFNLNSAVESIMWSPENELACFAGTENGYVHQLDFRSGKSVQSFQAHGKEVTGLAMNRSNAKILISVSADECMKLWDVNECPPKLLFMKDLKLEALHCIDMNPDYPYLACIGGSSKTSNKKILQVVNVADILTPKAFPETNPLLSLDMSSTIPLLETHSEEKTSEPYVETKKNKKIKKKLKTKQPKNA